MVPLSFASFEFHGAEWALSPCGALYWPGERVLVVADLHLEKASWYATKGQMLPPYDSRATLEKLATALRATAARRVICLGDSFHDAKGPARLEAGAAALLTALTRAAEWLWITGNHDPLHREDMVGDNLVGGTLAEEAAIAGLVLRHEARPGDTAPELSGHFHPKLRITARGRRIARPCAVRAGRRLILPAFGALTGGLDAGDTAIREALAPARDLEALLPVAGRLARYPLPAAPERQPPRARRHAPPI